MASYRLNHFSATLGLPAILHVADRICTTSCNDVQYNGILVSILVSSHGMLTNSSVSCSSVQRYYRDYLCHASGLASITVVNDFIVFNYSTMTSQRLPMRSARLPVVGSRAPASMSTRTRRATPRAAFSAAGSRSTQVPTPTDLLPLASLSP
eukprot:IDg8728t1